jgi:phosphopantetheine adenylyltransferase
MTNKKLSEKIIQIETRVANIEETMATKSDVNNMMNILDRIVKTTTSTNDAVKVIDSRTGRMEKWIQTAATKIEAEY